MLVVGLTGGIGSGKTTVASLFADLGVPIIDADDVAKAVTQPDQPAFMDIIDHFDEELLKYDGTLDRAKLREVIFKHPEERQWLENLLHPLIIEEMQRRIKSLTNPYCIAVIPLLIETGPYPFIDRILIIDTPEHLQRERATSRDKAHPDHIQAIINAQSKRDHRISQAHDIITNDSVKDHLVPQVESLHLLYTRLGR
jgi:dephospho-CoA kinase